MPLLLGLGLVGAVVVATVIFLSWGETVVPVAAKPTMSLADYLTQAVIQNMPLVGMTLAVLLIIALFALLMRRA